MDQVAARNDGLILTRDLVAAGLSDDAIRTVIRPLHRIARGAYVRQPPEDRWIEHRLYARAAVLRQERLVAISHLSAAVTHELPLWSVNLSLAHLTGIQRVRRGIRSGVHMHEGPLPDDDVVDRDGLDVTPVGRTVMDCARCLPFDRAVAIADHALHTGGVTMAELQSRCDRLPPVTGVDEARRLLDVVDGRAESPGESCSRLILVQAKISVTPQVPIYSRDGRFIARVDLLADEADVVVEFDGRGKYELSGDVARAHWQEKLRHDALLEQGYTVVRLTWADLADPANVVRRVRRALAHARANPRR